jgi:hypothetical protein
MCTRPLGLEGGLNLYGYVSNNPLKNVDPSGLKLYCTSVRHDQNLPEWRGACIPYSGCVASQVEMNGAVGDCRPTKDCKGRWGFDASITLRMWVIFRNHPDLPSADTRSDDGKRGAALRGHEENHVQDLMRWCINAERTIQTEGFMTIGQCQSARDGLERLLKQSHRAEEERSSGRHDRHR